MSGVSYNGLNELLEKSTWAKQYFTSLPANVQTSVRERSQSIKTEQDLQNYAQNIINQGK